MLNIIGKKNLYFLISLLLIIPGVISLGLFGLHLSIDFTGGSRIAYRFEKSVDSQVIQKIKDSFAKEKVTIATIQPSGKDVFIRTIPINEKIHSKIQKNLEKDFKGVKQESFETIGPTIGAETTQKAFYSVLLSSALILLYIAISFRKVPKPTTSWRFGVATILALLHDVLLLIGVFSLLGHYFNVEIDSLFITALLTVMGFSVHDTIVVFDRIRENLLRVGGASFAQVVNESILQTFVRSLNTSVTALLVLFTLLLFGGESVRWFIVALLIGIASGTYSSIFNAAPILVAWHEWDQKRKVKVKK
jgi:preprotein translocase subunit SecF